MAPVTQISQIQHRRGRREDLPASLAEGEFALTTDTGEVFIGAPNLGKIKHRESTTAMPGIYPYTNIKVLTEFDVVQTISDHVVTHSPLFRVYAPARPDDALLGTTTAHYAGPDLVLDTDGKAIQRSVILSDAFNNDQMGAVIEFAEVSITNSGTYLLPISSLSVVRDPASNNSAILFDLDVAGLDTILTTDIFTIKYIPTMEVARFPVDLTNSMIMHYSIKSTVEVDNKIVCRTGTLHIVSDGETAALMDQGVDLNQRPGVNYLRVVFSAKVITDVDPVNPSQTRDFLVITAVNVSHYPIHITYHGDRWSSNEL